MGHSRPKFRVGPARNEKEPSGPIKHVELPRLREVVCDPNSLKRHGRAVESIRCTKVMSTFSAI